MIWFVYGTIYFGIPFMNIHCSCMTQISYIMVGMTESGDPATGNINHANVIRHEFGCTCGVVDNLTPLGAHLIHDVLWNRDQVFFLHQNLNLTFTLKKKSANLYYGVHRLIVEWFNLGSCWQQEVLTTSLLLHVIYFCHFYSLLFHYEYENCQLA